MTMDSQRPDTHQPDPGGRWSTRLAGLFRGTIPVLRKEAIHIRRDPMALFVTVLIPIIQMFTIGFAIDTNVRDTRTALYDGARTQESRRLIDRSESSTRSGVIAS